MLPAIKSYLQRNIYNWKPCGSQQIGRLIASHRLNVLHRTIAQMGSKQLRQIGAANACVSGNLTHGQLLLKVLTDIGSGYRKKLHPCRLFMCMKGSRQLNQEFLQKQMNHPIPFLLPAVHFIFNGGKGNADVFPIHQDAEAGF